MLDFNVASGATLKVRVVTQPDQAMRDQLNRIERGMNALAHITREGFKAMSQAAQDAKREAAETRALVEILIARVTTLNETTAQLAETIRQNAGDNDALTQVATDLDTLQSETQAVLGGLVEPAASFPDGTAFADAVAKYKGPKGITLDGVEVKAPSAGAGSLDYFTHSADGRIDMTGPTD